MDKILFINSMCDKYIHIVTEINELYEKHIKIACELARSSNIVEVLNTLYKYPIVTTKQVADITGLPSTSVNRYMTLLSENHILYTNNKQRHRTFFYFDLLDILR